MLRNDDASIPTVQFLRMPLKHYIENTCSFCLIARRLNLSLFLNKTKHKKLNYNVVVKMLF